MSSDSSDPRNGVTPPDITDRPHARFFLQEAVEEHGVEPLNPETAADYATRRANDESPNTRRHNRQLFHTNVFAYDAMIHGWVLLSPVSFSVEEAGRKSYELTVSDHPDDTDLVNLTELGGDPVIELNTLWSLEFPEEYSALLTTPPVDNSVKPEVAPQHLLQNSTTTTPLRVILRVQDSFMVSRGEGVAQVMPIDAEIPQASYRTITDEEQTEITREKRRRRIYKSAYTKTRDSKRYGPLETFGDTSG